MNALIKWFTWSSAYDPENKWLDLAGWVFNRVATVLWVSVLLILIIAVPVFIIREFVLFFLRVF